MQQQIIIATGNDLSAMPGPGAFPEKLTAYIHELINHDFEKLISILYRLDVPEQKLKILFTEKKALDAGLLIADAIIERQTEKVILRKKFNTGPPDIPEAEKW